MNDKTLIFNYDQLGQVAQQLKELIQDHHIITLSGPLGAGKTTLSKALLRSYGVNEVITSPTFTYVNMYTGFDGKKLYHFDLYRISNPEQFIELGFDEFLQDPTAKVFIEWPEHIAQILPEKRFALELSYVSDTVRKLSYSD